MDMDYFIVLAHRQHIGKTGTKLAEIIQTKDNDFSLGVHSNPPDACFPRELRQPAAVTRGQAGGKQWAHYGQRRHSKSTHCLCLNSGRAKRVKGAQVNESTVLFSLPTEHTQKQSRGRTVSPQAEPRQNKQNRGSYRVCYRTKLKTFDELS